MSAAANSRRRRAKGRLTKPSGVTSVLARPPALSAESTINHDGPSCRAIVSDGPRGEAGRPSRGATHDVVQALGGTETRRSHANDEDINVTGGSKRQSVHLVMAFCAHARAEAEGAARCSHVGAHGGGGENVGVRSWGRLRGRRRTGSLDVVGVRGSKFARCARA